MKARIGFCFWALLVLVLAIECKENAPSKDQKDLAYNIACRVVYITNTMIMSGDVTPKMKEYLLSSEYSKLSEPEGREMLQLAFEICGKALKAREAGDGFKVGQLAGECIFKTVQAGVYYKFPECKNIHGTTIDLPTLANFQGELSKRGKELFAK
jgi:hypothetical protein